MWGGMTEGREQTRPWLAPSQPGASHASNCCWSPLCPPPPLPQRIHFREPVAHLRALSSPLARGLASFVSVPPWTQCKVYSCSVQGIQRGTGTMQ